MSLRKSVFNLPLRLHLQNILNIRCYCSKANNILETAEEQPVYLDEETNMKQLEKKMNKSRLSDAHRNILHGRKPYNESMAWFHDTVKYKKRMLGRYGVQSLDVPVGFAWPTLEEINEKKEYEKVAFPLSIQERLAKIKEEKRKNEEALMIRQQEVDAKMANMQKLIADVQAKIMKKQAAEEEAKRRKEQKIEEIRQQLIAEGTMSKEKFESVLSMAEKLERKKKKEATRLKRLQRQQDLLKKLIDKEGSTVENVDNTEGGTH